MVSALYAAVYTPVVPVPSAQFAAVTGTGSSSNAKAQFARVYGVAPTTPPVLNPPISNTYDSYASVTVGVTLDASGGKSDGYTWRQISGPTVVLTDVVGDPSKIAFVTPPVASGGTIVLGVVGKNGAGFSDEVQVQTVVLPHLNWRLTPGGVWEAVRRPVAL